MEKEGYKKILNLIFAALFVCLPLALIFAADNIDDVLMFRGGGDSRIPESRFRDGGGFENEATALDVGSTIEYVKVIAKPGNSAAEKFMCTKDSANDVNCQVYNGAAWGNLLELSQNAGIQKGYDAAYEQVSGEAMACYRSASIDTQTPACRIWNGSSWGPELSAVGVGGAIDTIRLIPDPASDYIALITKDASDDVNVQIWNGSSWGSLQEVSTNAGNCSNCLPYDASWETASSDLVVAWFNDGSDALYSREFDKASSWGAQITGVITGLSTSDNVYVETDASPDPASNTVLVSVIDDDNTLNANVWGGAAWGAPLELSTNINGSVTSNTHLSDLAFEHAPDFDAILTYGSTANALKYRVWDSGTAAWGTEQPLPTAVENKDWHQLAADPNGQNIMLAMVGVTNDVDTLEWNGSSWDGSWTSHETASNDANWNAWYTYDNENEANHPPVASFNSAQQKNDGSGLADISIEVSDGGLGDAKAKIEYEPDGDGACNGPWTKASLAGPVSADYSDSGGLPDLDNNADFQIGSGANTKIVTDSGANTIQFDWDSKADLASGNAVYCLRVTANDGMDNSEILATSTLLIDNVAPAGLNNFISMGAGATTQHLNWTSVTETNFDHYEIWYGTSQTDVESRAGTAVEFDGSDFLALNSRLTHHAHIIDLTPDTAYYYKIWAVDAFGNEQTVTGLTSATDPAGNTVPTATAPTGITQAVDGSGYVTFTATIHDGDTDETEMRVRFSIDGGATFYNAKIISVVPSYGTTSIDIDDFQIGHTDHIDTVPAAPHNLSLIMIWDTKSIANQNGGLSNTSTDVILRVTPRDQTGEIGNDYDSGAFVVDNGGSLLAEVTPVPAGTDDPTPSYVFSSTATGTIAYGGACTSTTGLAGIGNNAITFNALPEATYSNCTITVVDGFNNASAPLAVTEFTIDSTDPAGLAALTAGGNTQTTQTLNWTAVTEANFGHYEIWYGTNQADVGNRNGSASKWDQGNDASLAVRTTASTQIIGLSQVTTYYYKIWAVDIANNEATAAITSAATDPNNLPTGSINNLAEVIDGSKQVSVSISVDDADLDALRAKIEYETDLDGACNGPWAPAHLSGPVSAAHNDSGGVPNVDNNASYQLGAATGTRIITSLGANTVQFDWDAITDVPTANGHVACLRLAANDGLGDQSVLATATGTIDVVSPAVTAQHVLQAITVDGKTLGVAGIGDAITVSWDNSAAGDNGGNFSSALANLEAYGGPAEQPLYDDGTHGDIVGNDGIYSFIYTIAAAPVDSTNAHPHIIVTDSFGNASDVPDDSFLNVDAAVPAAAGSLGFAGSTADSVIISFGAVSGSSDFSAYKIFYRAGSGGVSQGDSEHADANLSAANFNGASRTVIGGLLAQQTYYFNIWVYDDAGNSAAPPEISVTVATAGASSIIPPHYLNPPTPPVGGFRITCPAEIGKAAEDRMIRLKLVAGHDTKHMAIATDLDFHGSTGIIPFSTEHEFDFCGNQPRCTVGNHPVYAKFYTQYGVSSVPISCTAALNDAPAAKKPGPTATSTKEARPKNAFRFTRPLSIGSFHLDVYQLQKTLNSDDRTRVALSGPGSAGQETLTFGSLTQKAVMKFQELFNIAKKTDPGYGFVGPKTRAKLNASISN